MEGEKRRSREVMEYEASPDVLKVEVEKWRLSLSYAIDSQDTQTTEKVNNCTVFGSDHNRYGIIKLLIRHTIPLTRHS